MQWYCLVFITIFLASAFPARGEEFSAFVGRIEETGSHSKSTTWQLEYREDLAEHFAISISYLNEGHLPRHHRDGHAVQLWAKTGLLFDRLTLAGGIGPYLYYDTTPRPTGALSLNNHGWGALASLSATWYTECPLLFQLRANLIESDSSTDTLSATFGIGYRFDSPCLPGQNGKAPPLDRQKPKDEITLFGGETSVHNRGPSHSAAAGVEYRKSLLRHVEWTASVLYEGESDASRRTGLASQIWAAKDFMEDRLSLGIGGGPYLAVERLRDPANERSGDLTISGLVTMTVSYRFHRQWGARFSWNRVITDYDRDSDIWLGGVSYRF